jgi:glycylpeptide N-tetradecanoyltransferase
MCWKLTESLTRALTAPGWKSAWHVGIRSSASHKLLAFISAVPKSLRVRTNIIPVFEFNFLYIDREMRGKRSTPILITEITRRRHREGIWHGLHTAGTLLPQPVTGCRYFHRPLNWRVLCEVKFGTTKVVEAGVKKYQVPFSTAVEGLREMEEKDVDEVRELWARYGNRFDMVLQFDREEVEHWFIPRKENGDDERVVWTYVVEVRAAKNSPRFLTNL